MEGLLFLCALLACSEVIYVLVLKPDISEADE